MAICSEEGRWSSLLGLRNAGRLRKQELLDERDVGPEVFEGGRERLAEFARPFADGLVRQEQREHARIISPGSSPTSNERPPSRSLIATIRSGTVCNTSSALRPGTIRPLGIRQEGELLDRRAAAVARAAGEGRQRAGRTAGWPASSLRDGGKAHEQEREPIIFHQHVFSIRGDRRQGRSRESPTAGCRPG